jgi:hypothetical protein
LSNELIRAGRAGVEPIDPAAASNDALLVILFFKSRSASFPFVVGICQNASRYGVFTFQGRPMHVAVFGRTKADAERASAVLKYAFGWRGVLIYAKGKLISVGWPVLEVVNCLQEAYSCRDRKAHCFKVIDDPFAEVRAHRDPHISIRLEPEPSVSRPTMKMRIEQTHYIFPCKYLYSRFSFQKGHPSSFEDQIQAGAVRQGCDFCPLFSPDDFQRMESTFVEVDAFE